MFKFTLDPDPPLTKIVDPDPPKVKRILTHGTKSNSRVLHISALRQSHNCWIDAYYFITSGICVINHGVEMVFSELLKLGRNVALIKKHFLVLDNIVFPVYLLEWLLANLKLLMKIVIKLSSPSYLQNYPTWKMITMSS